VEGRDQGVVTTSLVTKEWLLSLVTGDGRGK